MSQLFRAELSFHQILVECPNFCPTMVQPWKLNGLGFMQYKQILVSAILALVQGA